MDRKTCPLCKKDLSAKYLTTHIKKQHPEFDPPKDNKPKKDSRDKIEYTIPNNALSEIDILSFEMMEIDADEEADVVNAMFSSMSINNNDTDSKSSKGSKKRNQPELVIQKKLEKQYKGGHKSTPVGIIDIYTEDSLIEIKHWDGWKGAIGQLICYQYYYPKHMLHLHLFGPIPSDDKKIPIMTICAHNRIKLTYEKG
jgi:hypothetical protein